MSALQHFQDLHLLLEAPKMAIPTLLATLFPVVDGKLLQVGDLVKDFDFSKVTS